MNVTEIMNNLEAKHPGEKEYLQAVHEVLDSIEDIYNENPQYEAAKIIERLVEPDRILTFRVSWVDDAGNVAQQRQQNIQPEGATQANLQEHP